MAYISPVYRPSVPPTHGGDIPDAATPSPSRQGPFDYGHGEGVVRGMLPKGDPDRWEPSDAFKAMAARYPGEDEPMSPHWQAWGWAIVKAGATITVALVLIGIVGAV